MPNPLYTTPLIWSDDLNPAGAAEQFDQTIDENWDVFATAGQFVYQAAAGNGFTNGFGSNSTNYNTFMYGEQVGFKYTSTRTLSSRAAASFYTYSGTKGVNDTTGVAGLYSTAPLNLPLQITAPATSTGRSLAPRLRP